jgi:putative colanic acid biosynthesis acetyltransferase WcaF
LTTTEPNISTPASPPGQTIAGVSEPLQRLDTTPYYAYTFREYARRFAWILVAATLFKWSLPHAFRWRRWLLRRFGAQLAENTYLRRNTRIFHPWFLRMEEWSNLAGGVIVYNLGPVHIGRHTVCSQDVYLCAGTHDYTRSDMPLMKPAIRVGNGVWVATQAFIGPGVTIGDNTVIGARAVVMKDVPAGVVAAGNPVRVIKPRVMQPTPAPRV